MSQGHCHFDYEFPGGTLNCVLDYEEADCGEADSTGRQISPDIPATAELVSASMAGCDITWILSSSAIEMIEISFLQWRAEP